MGENNYQNMLNRLIDEKYTFTYKKLVVPMSMRSPYWKYFGFPATEEGSILTKVKIICVLCKTQIAYNKNTSNLRMHLQNRHPNELAELVAVHPPESRPSVKIQRQPQFPSGSLVLKVDPGSGDDSKAPRKRKFHRMLETTNSGFVKQGAVYATPVDGSIEIEGDLQFISDPTINISSFTEEEFETPVPNLQILSAASTNSPVVVVENSTNNQTESTASQPSNRIRIEEMSSIESKSICDAITDMIISDLMTPDIVEKHGFQSLVATLRSPCEIPSTSRLISEVLPGLYSHVKNNARTLLQDHDGNIGLSLEEWKCREGDTMVTLSAHFLHKSNTKVETRVLNTFHCPYDVTHNWTADVDAVLADWELDLSRVTAVIASSGQQSLLEVFKNKGITVVPCMLYSIQVAARACFEMDEVSHVLGKARALLNAFKKDLDDESTLKFQDQVFHLEEPLILDYTPVWLTTYHMIEQLQMFRTLVRAVLESGSEHIRQLWLTDEEWDTMEEIIAVLEPLRVAVLTLAEERVPLLSLLEPLLWQLVDSHLQTKDEDSALVLSLKKKLSDQLSASYSDHSCRLMLRTATQLDPRFKGLPHSDEAAKNTVVQQLHRSLENDTEEVPIKEASATPSKKNRLSGLLGKLCPDKSSSERAKNEFDQYNSMGSAALDSCPLEWWAKNAGLCPKLVKIARRYLCLLSCAIPLQRIPHTQQTAFHQARSVLSFDLADVLLFLNANYSR